MWEISWRMSPFRKVYSIIASFGCSQNRGSRGPCLADVRFNRHTWPGQGLNSSIKTSMFSFHISFPTMCATHLAKIITEETFLNLLNQKSTKSCWFQPPSYSEIICNNQEVRQVWRNFPSLWPKVVCLTIHLGQKHVVRQLLCKGLKPLQQVDQVDQV